MRRFICFVVLFAAYIASYAQQFRLVEDTVRINASDYISPISKFQMRWSVKYKGYYFCIFRESELYRYTLSKYRLLVFPESGQNIVEVGLPKDFRSSNYGDLFVRHDTLYLRPYHIKDGLGGYYFDMDAWQWKPVEVISDVIYDDDRYSVATIDCGEWGSYTWFIEKEGVGDGSGVALNPDKSKTSLRQYIMPGMLNRIIRKDNVYYFILDSHVDTLALLNGKAQPCGAGYRYEDAAMHEYDFQSKMNRHRWDGVASVPSIFRITGRDEVTDWYHWGGKTYDTVFSSAVLYNGDIYYLVNDTKKTYVAGLEDGRLVEKLDLGRRYHFFTMHDCYRGVNRSSDYCFEQFEVNKNEYGILEMKDNEVHVCHIIHNQDSLPHIGTDNIETRLRFLLDNFDNLHLGRVDSAERALRATCYGEFRKLSNGYYPDEYQKGAHERYSYYTVVDKKQTLEVDYCVHRSDSLVDGVFFEWTETNCYSCDVRSYYGNPENIDEKLVEVRQILNRITGKYPDRPINRKDFLTWRYRNLIIELEDRGRMVIYRKIVNPKTMRLISRMSKITEKDTVGHVFGTSTQMVADSVTVKGAVVDAKSGERMPFLYVWAKHDDDIVAWTITDSAGMFNLRMLAGTYSLWVSSVGYCDGIVTIVAEKNVDIGKIGMWKKWEGEDWFIDNDGQRRGIHGVNVKVR